ncbi:hypothetical protein C1645_834899 [Glomus cerebriforme]|uniref:Uncharacterized protein n=1 Tax=Glomus cerebriforme TaxID=658196 RepID=A0A397SDF7_9GLOM|nr:hypothetical protein C1645_834899 [Glomus cerebriforme]
MRTTNKYLENCCANCDERYTDLQYKWCAPCQVNKLKENFANWTNGNEKIDDLIQEMQLKIKSPDDIIIEWIPYCQNSDKSVGLKYFLTQNITEEFLNEVKEYSISRNFADYGTFEWIPYNQFYDVNEVGKEISRESTTGRQPFADCDHHLALDIFNRPNAARIEELLRLLSNSYYLTKIKQDDNEIKKQFKEAEKYRNTNRTNKSTFNPQAIYTSQSLNSFTKDLPEYINDNSQCLKHIDINSDCLDCAI